MTLTAGTLGITVRREAGAVRATLRPPQHPPIAEFLTGKPVEEAARLVPLVWNICAAAQEAAVRSALGFAMPEGLTGRIRAETLREHAIKLCAVWPGLLGEAAAREALGAAAHAADDPAAADTLRAAVFAPLTGAPASLSDLESWAKAGQTAPARAVARLLSDWDAGWGRADLALLDTAGPVDWETATQAGQPVENAPACRLADAPLLTDIAARRGHGLLWRIAARLVELDRLLSGAPAEALAAPGIANAARGAMYVRAAAQDGTMTGFARLSPTDFALAPGGVLETALATLPAEPDAPLRAIAQMIVETVDPCIATELEVSDA